MSRAVVVSGLGPVSGLGLGIEPLWQAVLSGRSAVGPIQAFDASNCPCRIAAEVRDLKVASFVPKSYRKAVKVMARDIEFAVAAADLAARDAGLRTKGTLNGDGANGGNSAKEGAVDTGGDGAGLSYPSSRIGAHIGAGLIAAEMNELTSALIEARGPDGKFDIHQWGREGINHLTPLWLLKYLPNMLACHVTIIHDAQGPSNTITCAEASSLLSIGESLRVIERGAADVCFCGGAESKINPLVLYRQFRTGFLNVNDNERAAQAVRPLCQSAAGTVVGEGGAIVVLESLDTFQQRRADPNGSAAKAYATVAGFGASQTVNRAAGNRQPDAAGRSIALAISGALREAGIDPQQIDLIVPFAAGIPAWDQAEAAALRQVFGDNLSRIPLAPLKSFTGNCAAGAGGLDICLAAKALSEQTIPPRINCPQPLSGLDCGESGPRKAPLRHVLTYSTGMGGQNAALVLKRFED